MFVRPDLVAGIVGQPMTIPRGRMRCRQMSATTKQFFTERARRVVLLVDASASQFRTSRSTMSENVSGVTA